jgi:hypothetical protein
MPLVCSPAELFPAAISLSRAICVQVRLRTGDNPTSPRPASSSGETGGNPAVPNKEFTSARFSARSRAVSSSSNTTYRDRNRRESQPTIVCHTRNTPFTHQSGAGFSLWILVVSSRKFLATNPTG